MREEIPILDNASFKPCNLKCSYCRPEVAKLTEDGFVDKFRGYVNAKDYITETKEIVEHLHQEIPFSINKVSGHGEITILENFEQLLLKNKTNQIITNGLNLSKTLLDQLDSYPELIFTMSLDGHTSELNQFRGPASVTRKALKNLQLLLDRNIKVTINCVLSSANMNGFFEFIEYLQQWSTVQCQPFPVRDFSTQSNTEFKASPEAIEFFCQQVESRYHEFANILPPYAYMKSLIDFLRTGKRASNCYIPFFLFSINNKYEVLHCGCGPTSSFGNLKQDFEGTLHNWKHNYDFLLTITSSF